ncbi:TolB-like protein [Roseateles toxinivorans]|uniref:TolB-like protein n=2 Tax=Roseateles toxinivorans TaxID=270368 RepID=A0A4V3CSR8_9BURK|nr:TolB-like protein [Roseateles toxinivorans]
MLHSLAAREHANHPGVEPLRLRAGLHKTELLADDEALYGIGVNLAARIAAQGQPGETLMSSAARDELVAPFDGLLQDMGLCWLKHVEQPVRLFRHRNEQAPLPSGLEAAIAARMKMRPTLVVLPLEAPPHGSGSAFSLGDVAADQLIRQLSQSSMLHVISPLSALALRGRELELEQLYRVLRADYVLRGSVVADSEGADRHRRLQLRVELWRNGSAEPIWNDGLVGSALDLLSPQSDLLGRVVHAVSHRILAVEQRAARAAQALPNLSSHTLHLAAVDLLHRFAASDFSRARELLLALSDRAPRHAEPMAWLARWHVFRVVQGWSDDSRRDGEQALYYSARALDRDPCSALALTMAGSVHAGVKRDAQAAQQFYAQALQHNPNDSLAWLMSSVAQGFMNERAPALAASEMALGLAPADPTRHYYDALSATAALRAGEYERCVILAERAITANGTHGTAYRSMAIAQAELGRHAEAAETMRRLLSVEPHFTVKAYLARVPSQDINRERFAQLLQEAGLPAA